ncbi:18843_t:CDS:2, partial [Entrophospora sp. SA101]
MDIKNDKIRTNESTTIATFVLHPNVIQAIKDKSPDDEHFDNVRHFYFGENQFASSIPQHNILPFDETCNDLMVSECIDMLEFEISNDDHSIAQFKKLNLPHKLYLQE